MIHVILYGRIKGAHMEPKLIELSHDFTLKRIGPELYTRGNVFAAADQRKTFLILSQKLSNTQAAIADLAMEECAISTLYEAADPSHRTAKCGSFRIEKMNLLEAPAWIEQHRRMFSKVYVAASNPHRWHIERNEKKDVSAAEPHHPVVSL